MMNDDNTLLFRLSKCFYRGYSNIVLTPEDVTLMTWDWQQKFLDATLNSDLIKKYPTSRQFTKLFLKKIIEYLEGNQEVHDDFYSQLCLVMNNGCTEESFCYKHYLINNYNKVITIKETNKMVVNGTTGMRTWEAALLLADWALSHKEVFENKSVLELGSGVGFTGISIGKLCQPKSIYLTDCHPEVMKAISDNIRINFPNAEVCDNNGTVLFENEERTIGVMPLDWNSLEDLPNNLIPDVVIGADIVYDPSILEPLSEVLKTFFSRNNQLEVYIASVVRNEETFQAFLKHLDGMKFIYEKLPLSENLFIQWGSATEKCLLRIKC